MNNVIEKNTEKHAAYCPSSNESSKDIRSNVNNCLVFYVNGKQVTDDKADPTWTLLYYLRNKLGLVGTKLGCAEGGCGACTVMVSKYDRKLKKINHIAVNACLTPVCAMHGLAVITVEGIGSTRTKLHPVQERIAKAYGSQCGFCTPGIVMSMYALLRTKPLPSVKDLEIAFQGNLCRCTGYRPIIESFKTFTEEWEQSQRWPELKNEAYGNEKICAMGDACCKKVFTSEPTELFSSKDFLPYDSTQEPIFPSKLQLSSELDDQYLVIKGKEVTWYRPTSLKDMLILKHQFPNAKIVTGNTEIGVEVKFKNCVYPILISPTQVKEMKEITEIRDGIKIGASVSLMEIEDAFNNQIEIKSEHEIRIFKAAIGMLHWFAGKQIRNVAAIGGNIMTGSPISDMNPVLMAAGVKLNIYSLNQGCRTVVMDHAFFTGYRRNIVAPDEILVSIEVPFSLANQYFVAFKQAKRRDDDIAIVNLALNIHFEPGTNVVQKSVMAFGGMAPTTVMARKTCEAMVGRKWNTELVEFVTNSLLEELPLSGDAPGGLILYRRSLTLSLFFKGFVNIAKQLQSKITTIESLPKDFESAGDGFHFIPPKSSQYHELIPSNSNSTNLVGKSIVHKSAFKQATGEAVYMDDIPKTVGELYLALVLSTKAHANILKIDPSEAFAIDGVVAYYDANDIPNDYQRFVGPIVHDEEIFVSKKVTSQGQVIGAIVASDQFIAQKASKKVKIVYEDLQPIISIEDAIEQKSFHEGSGIILTNGNVDCAFEESDHVLEGEVRIGGQEHFYLETQCALAIPSEDNEMEIICSTQHPTEIQKLVALMLDVPMNRINVRVKRLGGGFGGKESRPILVALPVAFAAHRLKKPVRCMLDRDEDMMISGTRHPFLFKYKVGFMNNGLIKGIEMYIYNNAGYSLDLSVSVLVRSMLHYENSYKVPASRIHGYVCKTNLPSNTAFRGFGGPQGMFAAETIIRHIAEYLGQDILLISEMNLYNEGDMTHFKQKLENCTLRQCWNECLSLSDYKERIKKIKQFNKENRYKKRGCAVLPTTFGIAYTEAFLNQGGALVHIYTDGSVFLSHGGTEMGQGLHTKMIQVASSVLKVNPDKIHISETATDKVPNTSATAASASSDLNGMAVIDACNKIMNRIRYIIDANPNGTWEDWIKKAYFDRISLSATGFYQTPDIYFNIRENIAKFNYFSYGAACSEVEIDCLTGDHQVLRTDIVMDLGQSLNPAIDIGQVEGGFIQGYGLFTLEEMIYSPTGTLFSRGPGAYKIPGFSDIPAEFNVSLLKGSTNPKAVYSSKAVGEPPLFLASSIFFAIREAIKAYRENMNIKQYFRLDSPATSARIRMTCIDSLVQKIGDGDGKKSWNIVP